ncbi:MAG: class I SAM-dependent methyltransferase [Patescibacteria group bacterium]|nr:class I SAM-dependent methyltransferase [Patescibacteria group bacterium]
MKIVFLLSPHFLIKYYLYSDIKKITAKYNFSGSIIDVGCGNKPYKKLFNKTKSYKGIDFKTYSKNFSFYDEKPDFYFDEKYNKTFKLPFKTNNFDNALSFQVLEHHKKPEIMIKEILRIIKKGGLLLVSFPLIWGLHEEPNDYYRFTEYGMNELVKKYGGKIITIKKQGAIFSTVSVLANDYFVNLIQKNRIFYLLLFVYPALLLFSYSCLIFDKIFSSDKVFLNYVALIKKERV